MPVLPYCDYALTCHEHQPKHTGAAMTVHTKNGDDGLTDTPGGQRTPKWDPRIQAAGTVDELNCSMGWALAATGKADAQIVSALAPVQAELLAVGAIVAAAGSGSALNVKLDPASVERMEQQIEAVMGRLPKHSHFVVPAGCELACRLHVARTVCRRAERAVARAASDEAQMPTVILKYVNRLSDLLFALARLANTENDYPERTWQRGGEK